jgi:Cu/Ag efflux pump CusA
VSLELLVSSISGLENNIYPGRFDHAYRVARQECHFDRRICHTKATQRNGFDKAAIEEARARLRPILMTLAFIFGLLPLALASGVGNRSIGMGAGGMLVGTVLGYL